MSDTPTDPREERPKLPYTFKTFKGHCENCETPFEIGGLILDEEKVQSINSNLAAEVERQNVILLSHSKAVGEFACGAPSVPDALRKLAAEIAELKADKFALFDSREELNQKNITLRAEIAELKDWKESAMSVMPPYQEIGEALGLTIGQSVHDKILPGIHALRTELKKARQALFQTEKRLDDKLRAALAELDAARKKLHNKEANRQYHMNQINRLAKAVGALGETSEVVIDTAVAAKDAAEKRVAYVIEALKRWDDDRLKRVDEAEAEAAKWKAEGDMYGWNYHQGIASGLNSADILMPKGLSDLLRAALTPTPTQEPPAGVIHGVTCEKVCHESANGYLHAPDDDGPYDVDSLTYCGRCHSWLPEPPAGGVTISNDSVNSETQLGPKGHVTAEGANSGQSADPGAVTISTEKKGGDEPCGHESETGSAPAVLLSKSTADATKDTSVASNSPADVPSEGRGECVHGIKMTQVCEKCSRFLHFHHRGRGECPMCRNTRFIGISPGVDEPCRVCAFNLSDALAGKPVVTRLGYPLTEIKSTSSRRGTLIEAQITDRNGTWKSVWWGDGKYNAEGDSEYDLFMLPTEGSGACKHEWKFNLLGNLRRCQKCNVTEPVEPAPPEL